MGRSGKRIRNPQQHLKEDKPFFGKSSTADSPAFFQAKGLTVGKPGDKYEKEADSVANAVVSGTQSGPVVNKKGLGAVQRESLSTPLEDEKLGTAEQRMEEDKLIQEQPMEEEEMIQSQEEEEEEMVQAQEEEEEEMVQAQEEEEEEMVQTQAEEEEEMVQTKSEASTPSASKPVSQTIKSESGKGKPLSGKVKKEMEKAFQTSFDDVTIHTGDKSTKLNKKLRAQAFTYGKDIFFNEGKFRPEQSEGKKLLAHELTHVVQQKKGKNKKT